MFFQGLFVCDVFVWLEPNFNITSDSPTNTSAARSASIVDFTCYQSPVFSIVSDSVALLVRTMIPFILMSAGSVVILRALTHPTLTAAINGNTKRMRSRIERQFTHTTLILNTLFFVTQTPLTVVQLVQNFFKYNSETPQAVLDLFILLQDCGRFCIYFYQAVQLFVYLQYNRVFFKAFENTFCWHQSPNTNRHSKSNRSK